ncbi:MAG: hypothetical protein WCG78_07570 [Candidatus Omnitrophota bacterium]
MEKSELLGVGFDNKDGHTRITKGKNFRIYGGSSSTHQEMQEVLVKFNERLDRKGKSLEEVSGKEFVDIMASIERKVIKKSSRAAKGVKS